METKRAPRASNIPTNGIAQPIKELNGTQQKFINLLEPSLGFKYQTNHSLTALLDLDPKTVRVHTRRLQVEGFLNYPSWQEEECNNHLAKPKVYELSPKGRKAVTTHSLPKTHRSNSYRHEMMVDLAFYTPLLLHANKHPDFLLLRAAYLLVHTEVPEKTRDSEDPFFIKPTTIRRRFDGTPFVIEYQNRAVFFPGIEADMGSEMIDPKKATENTTLASHLDEIVTCMKNKYLHEHYGIQNPTGIIMPILFRKQARMYSAMRYIERKYGVLPYLIFNHHPDITRLQFFPSPWNEIITTPWLSLGTLTPYLISELRRI